MMGAEETVEAAEEEAAEEEAAEEEEVGEGCVEKSEKTTLEEDLLRLSSVEVLLSSSSACSRDGTFGSSGQQQPQG